MCQPQLNSVVLPVPGIIAIEDFEVLGVANPQSWEREAAGGRCWYRSKERL